MPKNVMCKNCNNYRNQWCDMVIDSPDPDLVRDCRHFWLKTNADRIRAMTDEELIAFFVLEDKCPPERYSSRLCDAHDSCKDCWIDWLQQPAEGDA